MRYYTNALNPNPSECVTTSGCVTACVVCENDFEYAARSRGRTFYFCEVCDDCQDKITKAAKRRFNAKFNVKSAKEENFAIAAKKELLKMSQAGVARRLRMTLATERPLPAASTQNEFSNQPTSNEETMMTAKLPMRKVVRDWCESLTKPNR